MASAETEPVVTPAAASAPGTDTTIKAPAVVVSEKAAAPKKAAKATTQAAAKPTVKPADKAAPKAAVKKAAAKPADKPVAKSAVKPTAKPAVKAAVKPVAKPVVKAAAKPATTAAAKPASAETKPVKDKKIKMVRDSISIPKTEYVVLEAMKLRAAKLATPVKKTELIRAGIKALSGLPDAAFLAALRAVPSLKTGRPTKAE